MQIKYFETAWNDIKNSQGWVPKLLVLALVNFIPIFGQIVTFGYLYGWGREIAWGVHAPLPVKIFGNEDGKLYRRGWFAFVITLVFALIPSLVLGIASSIQSVGLVSLMDGYSSRGGGASFAAAGFGSLLGIVGAVFSVIAEVLAWVGIMRSAVYDRLSAGFQLGKIWKMARHDTGGLARIFGMNLLVGIIIGLVLSVVWIIVFVPIVLAAIAGAAGSGYISGSMAGSGAAPAFVLASMGFLGIIGILVASWVTLAFSLFVDMLTARALGYWMMQFDVAHWRGQDDPMPFEMQENAQKAAAAPPTMPNGAAAGVAGVAAQQSWNQNAYQPRPAQGPTWQPYGGAEEPQVDEAPVDVVPVAPVQTTAYDAAVAPVESGAPSAPVTEEVPATAEYAVVDIAPEADGAQLAMDEQIGTVVEQAQSDADQAAAAGTFDAGETEPAISLAEEAVAQVEEAASVAGEAVVSMGQSAMDALDAASEQSIFERAREDVDGMFVELDEAVPHNDASTEA